MIPSLHGLRGISILMVLFGHAAMCSGYENWWVTTYARAGVLTFFVVSGYLITTLMLREERLNVGAFYLRRAWRILPVAYAYLAIITALRWNKFSWADIAFSWGYLSSIGVLFETYPWDLGHLWSLSVEEMFYLVWPLLMVAGLPWAKWGTWAAIVIAPVCRYWFHHAGWDRAAHYSFPGVVDSVATGCLIAFYAKRLTLIVGQFRWAGVIWLVAALSPFLLLVGDHWRFLSPLPQLLGHGAWSLFNLSVGVGILWAIASPPRMLNHWSVVWVGTISYSLYIWHMPFMNPAAQIPFPFTILMSLLAAIISFYLLEEPMLRLRKQVSRSSGGQGRCGQGRAGRMANSQAVMLPTAPEN